MDAAGVISVGGNQAARPRMLICYLCGREYGTKSLPIHIPQCQKKWLAQEQLKPKNERRPLPEAPPTEAAIPSTSGKYNIDALNDAAYAQWEANLVPCPFCQRKFRPEAFKHHQKSCTADRPAKRAGTGLSPASLSNRLPPGPISGSHHRPPSATFGESSSKARLAAGSKKSWTASSSPVQACSSCGTPFERASAKFCSECGFRRV